MTDTSPTRLARILEMVRAQTESFLRDLDELVSMDSGTYSTEGVERVGDWFTARFREYGWETDRLTAAPFADCRTGTVRGHGSARLILLGHMDTVYPDGTAAARPITREGDVLRGPGTADMKAGLLTALYAVRMLLETGFDGMDRVTLFLNTDEEVGSPVSRTRYLPLAGEMDAGLVFECARENGDIVSARKGGGKYTVKVLGKSAHAGVAPETGANAIVQIARTVDAAARLNGLYPGVTVNAGVIRGGTRPNVVPDEAEALLDVRARDRAGAEAVHAAVHALAQEVTVPGTRIEIAGEFTGLPMEKTAGNAYLVECATEVARGLGFSVTDSPMAGGLSDANYLSALASLPVLDGLGPIGGADHGPDEYVLVSSIAPRVALAAGLIAAVCERIERMREIRAWGGM